MLSLSVKKIPGDYQAYRNHCKHQKKNILLNNIQIDLGYPQQIFIKNLPQKPHDYIQENKKNLKNFFKDRLPEDEVKKDSLRTKKTLGLDPLRIFQIKRQQYELKNQTKMILNGNIFYCKQNNTNVQSKEIEKIEEIFFINDKTLEFKKKFASINIPRFQSYSKDNHRRGTQSFMQKRSKLLKRETYDKVFGPDISSLSRTLPTTAKLDQKSKSVFVQKSVFAQKSKVRGSQKGNLSSKKQDLSNLLRKISDFKQKIKPTKLSYQNENQQTQNIESLELSKDKHQKSINQNRQNKEKVLELIHNITNLYKGQAIQENRTKLNSIQDLQKLDSKFYSELNQHKKARMQKRMYEIYKYSMPESQQLINSKIQSTTNENTYNHRLFKKQHSELLSITDNADNDSIELQTINLKKKLNVRERFRILGMHLVKTYLKANFFLVRQENLFSAFWDQNVPYQMQGSYAFFKAIKFDDFQCVQSFISINIKYLYEVDTNGKSPLIYASANNRQKIVQFLLEHGCNIDKTCKKKKNALYYALQNQNIKIVQKLLQYGADPWSTDECPWRNILNAINKQQFQIVFSNAKKIFLAARLQLGTKKRAQFWHNHKNLITYDKKILF